MEPTTANRIRQARLGAGFDVQAAFARKINVRAHTMWRYEKGQLNPSADVLARIAEATGVSMYWLQTGRHQETSVSSDVA